MAEDDTNDMCIIAFLWCSACANFLWRFYVNLHKRQKTTTRVRGVKGNKVLRTVKIRQMVGLEIHFGNTFATRLVCMILLINTIWSSSGYTQGPRRSKHR